ncbi:hypothetical protein K1W54_36615 [Micromonospora sp. CPCC 205371]|nr:hypothetical protein [Micromonospora sp. CPCC 205371]
MTKPIHADAPGAVAAAAAQRIAAYVDKNNIDMRPEQCEELAEMVIHFVDGFLAGTRHAATYELPAEFH